jgi:TPR repeat protein
MNAMVSGGFRSAVIGLRRCRLLPALLVAALALAAGVGIAVAGPTVRQGVAAMARQDYVAAAAILAPIAQRGNPQAQSYLGYLYEMGRGVPQDYTQAALWYRRAAEQGHSGAQFELGLLYDRGQGVPQDVVEAEKWLILATAGSSRVVSDDRARIRDAVRTKMTRGELAQARARALAWQSHREQ